MTDTNAVDPNMFAQVGHCREIISPPTHIFGYMAAKPEAGADEGGYMVKNIETGEQEFLLEADFLEKFCKTDENGKDWPADEQKFKDRPIRTLGQVMVELSNLPQGLKDVFM